jgi:putative redox protein
MSGSSEKTTFPNVAGEQLAARLDLPAGKPRASALFAHCFTCSKDVVAASRISHALTAHGIAVLRFDFTGLGGSEGEFANSNFSANVEDLVAAADHLREILSAPGLLIGHSLGGAAVLAAAHRIPEAVGVATIGAPFDPAHVAHLFQDQAAAIQKDGEAEVRIGGRRFKVRQQFLDDLAGQDNARRIGMLRKALLVCHAPRDEVVGIDNAAAIFQAAKHPKSFVSLDAADHLLTRKADAVYVADLLAAWAGRYLADQAESDAPAGRAATAPAQVTVTEAGTGRFLQRIQAGGHELLADEPAALGGDNRGPSPYDLVLAGLGACTTMTLRIYAARKGWPLRRASVRLDHDKIHAEDCADCETRTGKLDQIERVLELEGDLTEEQRDRLLEIADRRPVHRTLTHEIKIRTRLED